MKAAVLYGKEDLRYEDYQNPEITDGTVIVKIHFAGICGSDLTRVLEGNNRVFPIVLGHEFSGEIVEVGNYVDDLKVGDRVSGVPLLPCMVCSDCQKGDFSLCKHYSFIGSRIQGGFAEYVRLPAVNVVRFDPEVSYEQGAFFEPSAVALNGLKQNDYKGGGDVAVLGGGTIGIFMAQWARIYGAKSVTVFDISPERLNLCKKFGIDNVVNPLDDVVEKNRYNYVFETAGVTDTMRLAFEIAANRAHVCFVGTPTKELSFSPELFENMNRKQLKLTGSWMSYSAPFPGEEWTLTAHFFKTGQLLFNEELIFKRFHMSEAPKAFEMFKTPGAVKGKVLLYN